jgi:hypothetical protein
MILNIQPYEAVDKQDSRHEGVLLMLAAGEAEENVDALYYPERSDESKNHGDIWWWEYENHWEAPSAKYDILFDFHVDSEVTVHLLDEKSQKIHLHTGTNFHMEFFPGRLMPHHKLVIESLNPFSARYKPAQMSPRAARLWNCLIPIGVNGIPSFAIQQGKLIF